MPDLNKIMNEIQKESTSLETNIKGLLLKYETLFRDGNRIFIQERLKTGSMEGLESFHRLINTIRRNRDVISSLLRGCNNLRSISDFKFVEEQEPKASSSKNKKSRKKQEKVSFYDFPEIDDIEEPEYETPEDFDG